MNNQNALIFFSKMLLTLVTVGLITSVVATASANRIDSEFSRWVYCEADGWFAIIEGADRNSSVIPEGSTQEYTAYSFCFKVEGLSDEMVKKATQFCQKNWASHPLVNLYKDFPEKTYTLPIIRLTQKSCEDDLAWTLNNLINRFPSEPFDIDLSGTVIRSLRFER